MAISHADEALCTRGIRKSFGPLEVLKGVDLTARKGDVMAIIGGSGSGKSTLLRCLNLLEHPTAGSIRVNGEDVRAQRRQPRRLSEAGPRGRTRAVRGRVEPSAIGTFGKISRQLMNAEE